MVSQRGVRLSTFLLATALSSTTSTQGQSSQSMPPVPPTSLAAPAFEAPVGSGGAGAAGGNLVINGDLEFHSAGTCTFNQSNAQFVALMSATSAFGTAEELDIMPMGLDCGQGSPAVSGLTKVGMHRQLDGDVDAFGLELFSPIVAGRTYVLSFQAEAFVGFGSPFVDVTDVGITNNPTAYGTHVFSGLPVVGSWTEFRTVFVAPVGATHLTVRQGAAQSYNNVDDFQLYECTTSASATFRNAGGNPASLSTTLPVLGSVMTATVDLTTTGHNLAFLAAYASPLSFTLGGGQVLLHNIADPAGELLGLGIVPGPNASFSIAVPADANLCGFFAAMQAAHFGGVTPFALSNAQDLIAGA